MKRKIRIKRQDTKYCETQFYRKLYDEWNCEQSISNLNVAILPISMKISNTKQISQHH